MLDASKVACDHDGHNRNRKPPFLAGQRQSRIGTSLFVSLESISMASPLGNQLAGVT